MRSKRKSVTIQGAKRAHHAELARVAEGILNGTPPGSIDRALEALLDTGLVIRASMAGKEKRNITIRVEQALPLSGIQIAGAKKIDLGLIQDVIRTRTNHLLNARALEADLARIKDLYRNYGLVEPKIRVTRSLGENNTTLLNIEIDDTDIRPSPKKGGPFRRPKDDRIDARAVLRASIEALPPVKKAEVATRDSVNLIEQNYDQSRVSSSNHLSTQRPDANADRAESVLERTIPDSIATEIAAYTSSWTGKLTKEDHVRTIRAIAPRAIGEIETLIELVEARRFNDPETAEALTLLRALHQDLGMLIEAIELSRHKPLLVRIARKNAKLQNLIHMGAKVGVVAPALTIGISHLLSALTRVPIDSTMVVGVFATSVALIESHSTKKR